MGFVKNLRNIFIYYFSKPVQIDDCIMVEVVRKRNSSAWDLYFLLLSYENE